MYLATAEEMEKLDRLAMDHLGIPGVVLMENAGLQVVKLVEELLGTVKDKRVAVFAGKGNNGGDGFVIARHLLNMGAEVKVMLFGEPSDISGDARVNLDILEKMGQKILPINNNNSVNIVKLAMVYTDVIIDAIFGTGFKGAVDEHVGSIVNIINGSGKPVVAVDIPSGVEANTGKTYGPCIRAQHTVTFALPKIGLAIYPGRDYTGKLHIADISIPGFLIQQQKMKNFLITRNYVADVLPRRHREGHKGDYGRVLVLGGSEGMTGAVALTSMAALRSGAGLVTLALPKSLHGVMEAKLTEVMTRPLPETERRSISRDALEEATTLMNGMDVVALGPGMSTDPAAGGFVTDLVPNLTRPTVIDADGLNALIGNLEVLKETGASLILTPHPGEMARLMGIKTEEVQDNRVEVAKEFASKYKVTLVLKGACTLVAGPKGELYVNETGNPGMATGGTGDVLTGVIAGLLAQGLSPLDASVAGVYLHGCAGDLAACNKGEFSLVAGDILDLLPEVFKEMED